MDTLPHAPRPPMLVPEVVVPRLLGASLVQVTDRELSQFAELIYQRTGVCVSPHKKTLLSNRLRRRLRATGIEDFSAYYDHLRRLPARDAEWDAFLQEITTHETYLFRDEVHWHWLRENYLPQCVEEARAGKRRRTLRVWSAACSTGDEPTTVACCLAGCLPETPTWDVRIVATDIGTGALEQAREGCFGDRAMRLVPKEYRDRFFTKLPHGPTWQAKPALRNLIHYRQHNLLEPLRDQPFDLVILKNVLIYFDAGSKRTVLQHVRDAIRPGGLLLAGAAEGVGELLRDFHRRQPWLYQKADTPSAE